MRSHVVLFLVLLLSAGCTGSPRRSVQTVCEKVPVHTSRWSSDTPSSLPFGTRLEVEGIALSNRLRVVEAGDGMDRFLSAECLAPFPLPAQPHWVHALTLQVERPGSRGPQPLNPERTLGDAVEAVVFAHGSPDLSSSLALVSEGAVLGFVRGEALGGKAPDAALHREHLASLLIGGELARATQLTRLAAERFPREVVFPRLLGHLVAFEQGQEVRTPPELPPLAPLAERLPPRPFNLSEEAAAKGEPLRVYSAAGGQRLLEAAAPEARERARLKVNQPLELHALEGEWARVTVQPGHHVMLVNGVMTFMDKPPLTGYVERRVLRHQPLDAEHLFQQAQEVQRAARHEESLALLHQALEVGALSSSGPSNDLFAALVRGSLASGRFEDLFQWLTFRKQPPPAPKGRGPSAPLVVMGCKGDRTQARFHDLRDREGRWAGMEAAGALLREPDVCVGGVDPRAPREPREFCPDVGPCTSTAALFEARKQYRDVLLPAYREWHERVEQGFGGMPFLVFEPLHLFLWEPYQRLMVYDLPLQGMPNEGDARAARLLKDQVSITELVLPRAHDARHLVVWLPLPDYLDREFGLVFAHSPEQVKEWIQHREDTFDYPAFRVADTPAHDEALRLRAPFQLIRLPTLSWHGSAYWWRDMR